MRFEKIDITKTAIEIPDGRTFVDFVVRDAVSAKISAADCEVTPSFMIGGTDRYQVQVLKRKVDEQPINYLIKLDDHKIFQDLLKVSDETFKRAVGEKTDFYRDWMKRELENQRYTIKRLPWWERLFKKF